MATKHSKLELSDDEWRRRLSPEEFDVLRRGETEEPYSGEYTDATTAGSYLCRACGAEVFCSTEKFDPDTGFASFYDAARDEVLCAHCGSHLGHLFTGEGYPTPIDQRFCINSMSLKREPATV
jgi:peptide-methionine (R)-S-oxide reductase